MNNEQHLPPVIGIDLGGTQVRVAVLRGTQLISRVNMLTGNDPAPNRLIPRVYGAVRQALDEAMMSLEDVTGIGIGVAGLLDSQTGIVFSPNLASWDQVPLFDIFRQQYKVPIFIENDANAAGLGEYMFGAGQGSRNFVYLTVSTGIGGCVIIDGHILRGTNGTAAELGHMVVDLNGERCSCGNIGCLESITSGTSIARNIKKAVAQGIYFPRVYRQGSSDSQIDAKEVAWAAEAGIPIASEIIQRAGEALGVGLVNIIHIFNPEIIVLGGGVTQIGPLLLEPAQRIVRQRAMKAPATTAHIAMATLGADVGLIGAGALVYVNKESNLSLGSQLPLPVT